MGSLLLKSQEFLIGSIIKKAKEMNIPISLKKNFIGFGMYENFYLFYISIYSNKLLIKIRSKYCKKAEDNILVFEVNENNMDIIATHIDNIHNEFLKSDLGIALKNKFNDCSDLNYKNFFSDTEQNRKKEEKNKNIIQNNECDTIFSSLSFNTQKILLRAGINTLDELLNYDIKSLIYIKECRKNTLKEIMDFINRITKDDAAIIYQTACNNLFKDYDFGNAQINVLEENTLIKKYKVLAEQIQNVFKEWPIYETKTNYKEIFNRAVFDGKALQEVGNEYGYTRSNVSMIVKRISETFNGIYPYYCNETMNNSKKRIDAVLMQLTKEEYADFFYYGFNDCTSKLKKIIFEQLIGKTNATILSNNFKEQTLNLKKISKNQEKLQKNVVEMNTLLNKITFSSFPLLYKEKIIENKDSKIYQYMFDIKRRMLNINPDIQIIFNPNVSYLHKRDVNYYPDLLLKLPNGKLVLVLVTETLRFAMQYNKTRFELFKKYCFEHGFGALIINFSLLTYEEILKRSTNFDSFKLLDEIIDSKGCIYWDDIKKVRQISPLTNYDIVNYITMNNYIAYLNPFLIKIHN